MSDNQPLLRLAETRHAQLLQKCHQLIRLVRVALGIFMGRLSGAQQPGQIVAVVQCKQRNRVALLLPQLGFGGEHTAAASGLSQDLVQRQRVHAAPLPQAHPAQWMHK